MSLPRISFLVLAAMALLIPGCKVNTINSFPSHPATVGFINLMPDSSTLDVKVNGSTAWSGVGFTTVTATQQFDNTQTTFSIHAPEKSSSLANPSGSLSANAAYTLVAFGTLDNPKTLFQSDEYADVNSGNMQVRFVHTGYSVKSLDLYLTDPGTDISDKSPQYQLGYGGNTTFVQTSSGDSQLRAIHSNSSLLGYDSGTIALADKAVQSFYFFASTGTHAFNVLAVNVLTGEESLVPNTLGAVKVVNAAYQAGAVNQLWDGNVAVTNLSYPAATEGYYTLPVGTHSMTFEANATPGAPIATSNETIVSATDSTMLVSGANGSQVITMLADNNLNPSNDTENVRFINASADVPAFDVVIDDKLKASNVAYTHASDYISLSNSNHKVQLMVPGTSTPIFTVDSQSFADNEVSSFYLTGPQSDLKKIVTQDSF